MNPEWILALWLCLSGVLAKFPQKYVNRNAVLDENRRFYIEWETGENEYITFKVVVRTLGYVALGFSKDGTMVNSDIVVGWVTNGEVYLQDRYAEGNQMPELDRHQDWELLSGGENATHTTLTFRRKLDTCDSQDFALVYDNTIRVMHAYSYEDPLDEINIPYHGPRSRGWKSFLLLQPSHPRELDVEYWDVMTQDFTVSPEWDTLYWCRIFRSPNLDRKHHVTTVEPLILGGNRGHVHHVVLFECAGADPEEFEPYVETEGYPCLDPNSPEVVRKCDGTYTIWGQGGDALVLPDHIGMPLDQNMINYFMLEIHFDNENRVLGTPGRTGLRLHHTPRLRPNDAGLLLVGAENNANMLIPPGIPDFKIVGHGNPDCIGPFVPPSGVWLFGAVLHTHLLGSRIKSRHFRNNIELPPVAYNKNYDPSYQEHFQFSREILLLPSDQLTCECTYDSTNRTTTSFGGFSTREEMCTSFMIYYPRFEGMYGSLSLVPKRTVTKLLDSEEIQRLPTSMTEYDQTFRDYMTTYDWNKTAIRRFEEKTNNANHETLCYPGNGEDDSVQTTISYPENLHEYFEPPTCSSNLNSDFHIKHLESSPQIRKENEWRHHRRH